MSVQLLRFSFPFQFHVLVDTDTYKASILIWRISLSFQTCSERQIGMFYPHLKYFPTLMEIHFVDDLANPESIRSSFMTLGSKETMTSIFCVINGFTITKKNHFRNLLYPDFPTNASGYQPTMHPNQPTITINPRFPLSVSLFPVQPNDPNYQWNWWRSWLTQQPIINDQV